MSWPIYVSSRRDVAALERLYEPYLSESHDWSEQEEAQLLAEYNNAIWFSYGQEAEALCNTVQAFYAKYPSINQVEISYRLERLLALQQEPSDPVTDVAIQVDNIVNSFNISSSNIARRIKKPSMQNFSKSKQEYIEKIIREKDSFLEVVKTVRAEYSVVESGRLAVWLIRCWANVKQQVLNHEYVSRLIREVDQMHFQMGSVGVEIEDDSSKDEDSETYSERTTADNTPVDHLFEEEESVGFDDPSNLYTPIEMDKISRQLDLDQSSGELKGALEGIAFITDGEFLAAFNKSRTMFNPAVRRICRQYGLKDKRPVEIRLYALLQQHESKFTLQTEKASSRAKNVSNMKNLEALEAWLGSEKAIKRPDLNRL